MKYIFSIAFIFIYLAGSLQSSWVLIDFYMNRDDYTQKYCLYLDGEITQCRASCYLEKLQEKQQKGKTDSTIISSQQHKIIELISQEKISFKSFFKLVIISVFYDTGQYQFDFQKLIFHPPKV